MSFIYDYSHLTNIKYSTKLSRDMDNYVQNESSPTLNRSTKPNFVEHSNPLATTNTSSSSSSAASSASNSEFNTLNNHFDCLINDVDEMQNEAKTEDEIISMASRYESFLTNDPINRSHSIQNESNQLSFTNNGYNNYIIEKNLKYSNEFLNNLNKFQYILMAPTSPAVKSNEETLTYLNQGQNYELRINRFNNNNNPNYTDLNQQSNNFNYQNETRNVEDVKPLLINGKISRNDNSNTNNNSNNTDKTRTLNQNEPNPIIYLSIIRLCFWDRKLQEVELEEIREWEKEYANLRMLEIDNNSSYGIIEVRLSDVYTNAAEVLWNGKTGASIFFRCNCTSTAFAPHKHGGEKGIHMRLQIDTYDLSCANGFYQNGNSTTNNLTINTTNGDYHSTSILSPPNSSSSPAPNKFIKDDLEYASSSDYQKLGFQPSSLNTNNWKHACSSYSRIQLFRLKGAQRKLKTDRSKIERLNPPDLRKRYQPSNKITILYNCPYDQLYSLVPFNHNHNSINHSNNNNNNIGGPGSDTHNNCEFNSMYMNPISNTNLSQQNSTQIRTVSSSSIHLNPTNYGLMVSNLSATQYPSTTNEYISYNNETMTPTTSSSDDRHHFFHYDSNLSSYNQNQTILNKSIIKETSLHEMSSIQPSYQDLSLNASTYQNDDNFCLKRKSSLTSNIYSNQTSTTNNNNNNNFGSMKFKMQKLNETNLTPNYVSISQNIPKSPLSNTSSPPLSPTSINFSSNNLQMTTANYQFSNTVQNNNTVALNRIQVNYPLAHDCNNKYVQEWLINNRFCHLLHLFSNYTSNDFLRLSKEDMINLCGAPDGIRCFNIAHNIQIRPKLTIFITFQSQTYFSAVFLSDWKNKFLINKIFNHYYQFLISLPNSDNKNLKELTLKNNSKDQNNSFDDTLNKSNNENDKLNSHENEEDNQKIELLNSQDNNIEKNNQESENQTSTKNSNCENYVINESHYKFYELIKNSCFEYELFLKVKDILVKTNDEVLNNLQDQSRFMIEFEPPSSANLKHANSSQNITNISTINNTSSKSDSNLSSSNNINIISKTKLNNIVKIIMIPID